MPLIHVDIIENVFTPAQKLEIVEKLTDAMVEIEGPALRSVTWVKINEVKESNWAIGGQPLRAEDVLRMQAAGAKEKKTA
jgi:4-oxalocrotonate tautomerase